MDADDARMRFHQLHAAGTFVIPNPFDLGSAKLLEALGAQAVATTSSGLATSLGTRDMRVTRDQLVAHVAALAPALGIPVHVDAEQCFPDDPGGVGETARLLLEAGVRRVSTGGGLASVAYQAFVQAARHVLDQGVPDPTLPRLDPAVQAEAFGS